MNQMSNKSKVLYEDQLLPVKHINSLRADTRATQVYLLQLTIEKDPQKREVLKNLLTERSDSFGQTYEAYKKTSLTAHEKELIPTIDTTRQKMKEQREILIQLTDKKDTQKSYAFYLTNVVQEYDALAVALVDLADYKSNAANKLQKNIASQGNQATLYMIVIIVIAAILAITLGVIISRMLTNPINEIVDAMGRRKKVI